MHQKKTCGQKNVKFHAGVKSAILAIFQRGPGWPCPVSAAIKNPSHELNIFVLFWVPIPLLISTGFLKYPLELKTKIHLKLKKKSVNLD